MGEEAETPRAEAAWPGHPTRGVHCPGFHFRTSEVASEPSPTGPGWTGPRAVDAPHGRPAAQRSLGLHWKMSKEAEHGSACQQSPQSGRLRQEDRK